jgi:hypothetical protein
MLLLLLSNADLLCTVEHCMLPDQHAMMRPTLPRRYVFLLDAAGRLRWRGSGSPAGGELATLLRCTEELLQQEQG